MGELRVGRQSSRLNMARSLDQAMKGEGRPKSESQKKGPRELLAEMAVLYRNEKLGEGSP